MHFKCICEKAMWRTEKILMKYSSFNFFFEITSTLNYNGNCIWLNNSKSLFISLFFIVRKCLVTEAKQQLGPRVMSASTLYITSVTINQKTIKLIDYSMW